MLSSQFCRWAVLVMYSLCFGLPSTLSSDAHFREGTYYEFDQSEHTAREQRIEPADTPPQPFFEDQIQKRLDYQEKTSTKRNYFNNKIPQNKIPRNSIPKGQMPRNQIQKSPIPRNSIQRSPLQKNTIPKQGLERKKVERNPMPRTKIQRNPIPRN